MTIVLPTFVTGQPFSASQMNQLSETLRAIKAVADRPRVPFTETLAPNTGYIQHAYDTLQYQISGSLTVTYNGNSLGSLSGSGTVSLASLGLTVGAIYIVTITGSGTLQYLSEVYQPTYSAPPTFANGTTLTATNLNALVDRTDTLINLAQTAPGAFPYIYKNQSSWNRGDSEIIVYRGWMRYTADLIECRFFHSAQASATDRQKSRIKLIINGTEEFSRQRGGAVPSGWTVELTAGDGTVSGSNVRGEFVTAVEDIFLYSLTLGNIYLFEIRQDGTGTNHGMDLKSEIFWLGASAPPSGATAPFWADPPTWAEDGTNISAARLNLYRDAINYLFPGSGTETSPVYYDNYVQFATPETKRFMRHFKKYAALVYDGEGTVQAYLNLRGSKGNSYGLTTKDGVAWTDLDKIPNFYYGDYYMIDDVIAAFEVDDVNQL